VKKVRGEEGGTNQIHSTYLSIGNFRDFGNKAQIRTQTKIDSDPYDNTTYRRSGIGNVSQADANRGYWHLH
jgi:hypothetical protein